MILQNLTSALTELSVVGGTTLASPVYADTAVLTKARALLDGASRHQDICALMYLGASWKSPLKLKSALVTGEASRKSKFFVIVANASTTREGSSRICTSVFW